jgi:hypothetical protein
VRLGNPLAAASSHAPLSIVLMVGAHLTAIASAECLQSSLLCITKAVWHVKPRPFHCNRHIIVAIELRRFPRSADMAG